MYFGIEVNITSRLIKIGWGGQILVTENVVNNLKLPESAEFQYLGSHILKNIPQSKKIYQLIHPEITLKEFPPLRSLISYPNNLPKQSTPFIGGKEALKTIEDIFYLNLPVDF